MPDKDSSKAPVGFSLTGRTEPGPYSPTHIERLLRIYRKQPDRKWKCAEYSFVLAAASTDQQRKESGRPPAAVEAGATAERDKWIRSRASAGRR